MTTPLDLPPFSAPTLTGQEQYGQLLVNALTLNLLDDKMFCFGPLLNPHFGWPDGVEDEYGKHMNAIDAADQDRLFATMFFPECESLVVMLLCGEETSRLDSSR